LIVLVGRWLLADIGLVRC